MEFTHLMQRFYATANKVLVDNDALIDKFVGDEVVGFFMPFLAGPGTRGGRGARGAGVVARDRTRRGR